MADKATNCECGQKFGKTKHTIREKVQGDGGFFIVRKRVCLSCLQNHYERSE